jgi:hypothetical protein
MTQRPYETHVPQRIFLTSFSETGQDIIMWNIVDILVSASMGQNHSIGHLIFVYIVKYDGILILLVTKRFYRYSVKKSLIY